MDDEKYVNDIARPLAGKTSDLDAELTGKDKLNDGREKLSTSEDSEPIRSNNLSCVSDEKVSLPRLASLELTELGGEDGIEKILEELQNFLPKWVIREQLLDMIRGTGGNIVEIINNFYEHETKFYEQVSSVVSISSCNRVCFGIDAAPVSELAFVDCIPEENKGSHLAQFQRLQGTNKSRKSSISPVKRNKKTTSKVKKKAKANSKPKSTDSKQATITKFFSKVSIEEPKA